MVRLHLLLLTVLLAALGLPGLAVRAEGIAPPAAEMIRRALFNAQLDLSSSPAQARQFLEEARTAYDRDFAGTLKGEAPQADDRIRQGFDSATVALDAGDAPAFAAARSEVWTGILAGGYNVVEQALLRGDGRTAQTWLSVREFRPVTRFSRPSVGATLAVEGFLNGKLSRDDAILALRADLLDTYQARLTESLRDLTSADISAFTPRRVELAALAEGYFLILAPAYGQQRGANALSAATADLAQLRAAALHGGDLSADVQRVESDLQNFRAAPLSAAEQSRRAGQLLRFLSLVPVEYGRGVADGRVTHDLEIQEAITFHAGAQAAFSDLESLFDTHDHATTVQAKTLFDALGGQLAEATSGAAVASPDAIQAQTDSLTALLKGMMPEDWLMGSSQGDFDVVASILDQMQSAVRGGDYELAESSRLEAYAVMETGPEARLTVFAPELKSQLEDLFWNGTGPNRGLAYLIKNHAAPKDVGATRSALDAVLVQAQAALGVNNAPAAVAANAGLIVFREGLEAVVILASLMSSMKRAEERKYRKPMWIGTALAILATALTWSLAHSVLQALARYGEKLEAIVSLVAIVVLLLITNWFFHKTYWTDWIASFHSRKRQLITGEAGLWLGLAILGFTSVYREGFEIVLFLQALVLEAGSVAVLTGTAVALLAVVLVGIATFRLQRSLPYMKILIVTGVLISGVLLQIVGNTVHVMQLIGWLPVHLIQGVWLPYWTGMWFGLYATWEGVGLQLLSAGFVIGSYYLAQWMQARRITKADATPQTHAA